MIDIHSEVLACRIASAHIMQLLVGSPRALTSTPTTVESVKVVIGLGQVVSISESSMQNHEANFTIDVSGLPSGYYILNVNGESTALIKK
jgi:hypothetical protein